MARAAARDPARDDLAPLGDQAAQATHVLVIDEVDLVSAELADLPPAEPAALDGLLNRGNRSALLLGRGTRGGVPSSPPVYQNGTSSSLPCCSSAAKPGVAGTAAGAPAPPPVPPAPLVRL